jgi:hypothetical protein
MENYSSIFDYNPNLFTVYDFPNKIRIGHQNCNEYVVGLLDTVYDCYITVGISDQDGFTVDFLNQLKINKSDSYVFNNTINLYDVINRYNNVFLKMDIEGSEWEWLCTLDENTLNKISQIAIELHGITNTSYHNNFNFNCFNTTIDEKISCIEKLNKTHYIIHAHGNNADKTSYNGIPNVIKITFVNKKHFIDVPSFNRNPLPDKNLDFPNEKTVPDIDLNFYPFVNNVLQNPFLINAPEKTEYNVNDYIDIQKQLDEKNIDEIIESLYTDKNKFYGLDDFKFRINRGIKQKLLDSENNPPNKTIYKMGNYDNNKNCIVCCTAFKNDNNESRYLSSNNIIASLTNVGYNGHFILFQGGFPNPTGKEMKYVGVPYCFKIFMMLEAVNLGFKNVIWLDSGCYALNNPDPLFEILEKDDVLIKKVNSNNNYNAMSFEKTIRLLNQLTKCDLHSAPYIETIVFGLNMMSDKVQNFIKEYYDMVDLGWPFFSIFPEEIVISAIFNQPYYKPMLYNNNNNNNIGNTLYIHEKYINETDARNKGYYFHHKNYIKNNNNNNNKFNSYI